MSQTAAEAQARFAPKPPKAVSDAVAAAEKMMQPQQPPAPQQPAAPTTPPPPANPQQAQPPAPPAAPPAPQAPAPEDLEQRFRSANGRVETLTRENQQLIERLNQLEGTIATMRATGPATPPPAPAPKPKLVTQEEENEFGADMLTVVGKKAREEFVPELDALRMEVSMLKDQLAGTAQVLTRNQQQTVYQALDSNVPRWREINTSDEFKNWLGQVDPFAGRTRLELLQDAFTRQDAPRVLRFFQGFAEATGNPPAQPGPVAATPPAQPGHPAQPTLEELAAPSGARSGPQGLPPEKPTYTSAWIAEFMAARRNGKWKGREADADAIERDIYQAQHEGRIQV